MNNQHQSCFEGLFSTMCVLNVALILYAALFARLPAIFESRLRAWGQRDYLASTTVLLCRILTHGWEARRMKSFFMERSSICQSLCDIYDSVATIINNRPVSVRLSAPFFHLLEMDRWTHTNCEELLQNRTNSGLLRRDCILNVRVMDISYHLLWD